MTRGAASGRSLRLTPGEAGCDEAGRGPLAGPLVCAAVLAGDGFDPTCVDDSKKLTRNQRESAARHIRETCQWHIVEVGPAEVDRLNVLRASLEGMATAVSQLGSRPKKAYVDGDKLPISEACAFECVVKGDGLIAVIAAASILAKTHRDSLMRELALEYPQYGFEHNFGYPTPDHLAALREHGPSAVHRMSFAPVSQAANQLRLW